MCEGSSSFPKLTACIEPVRAECVAKSQTPAEQFLTFSSIARFGVDPRMADFREEFCDMDAHNRLRNYGLTKSMELLPRLDADMTDGTKCLSIICGAAHFSLAEDQNVSQDQQAQVAQVMDKAWSRYFEIGWTAAAAYKELGLEHYSELPKNNFRTKAQDLANRLAEAAEFKSALNLQWVLAHSYSIGSVEQCALLQAVQNTIATASRTRQNDDWLYKFSEQAVRNLTGVTDDIPRHAIAWLAHDSYNPDEVLPPDAASSVLPAFVPLARTMMGVMEKRADQLLASEPKAAAKLFFLLSRLNLRGQTEQRRLADKTVNAYEKWLGQETNPGAVISHISEQLRDVDGAHPVAVALTGFRDAHLVNPIRYLHEQLTRKLDRVTRRAPVKRSNKSDENIPK